jgi:hypothetical protein
MTFILSLHSHAYALLIIYVTFTNMLLKYMDIIELHKDIFIPDMVVPALPLRLDNSMDRVPALINNIQAHLVEQTYQVVQ